MPLLEQRCPCGDGRIRPSAERSEALEHTTLQDFERHSASALR